MNDTLHREKFNHLRRKAEKILQQKQNIDRYEFKRDLETIIEELNIHQIELELQNEELLRLQNNLRQTRDKYFALFELAPIGYFTIKTDFTIKEVNLTGTDMLKCERKKLLNKKITQFVADKDRERFQSYIEETKTSLYRQSCELEFIDMENLPFFGRLESVVLPKIEKGITLIQIALINITEQQNTKQALEKAKRHAEESDRLKSAFLANISHEIRTPMNSIMGFAELLKNRADTMDSKSLQYLESMYNGSKNLLKLINDIVDISQLEIGTIKLRTVNCSLVSLFDELNGKFQRIKEKSGKQIQMSIEIPSQNIKFRCDRGKLFQILESLLSNAIKFTEKGEIRLIGKVIESGMIQFSLSDTGIGIPKEKCTDIFKRFMQVDDSLSRKYGGTGLGLALAKSYVELMQGKIWVESEIHKGSTFHFTIPYHPVHTDTVSNQDYNWNKLTILIVDDRVNVQYFLKDMLTPTYCTILQAINSKQAIEIIKENDVDMVLIDKNLPDMNGCEVCCIMKEKQPQIKILLQTNKITDDEKEKARKYGCTDLINNPYNKDEILNTISKYI